MNLTAEELRVLACLVEKSFTTPEQYPLSSNALTAACNQKTSRDPIVDYPMRVVDEMLQLLRDAGWVRSARGAGSRVFKHRHLMGEQLGIGPEQEAVIAVLALRGPQSAGELKTRTERYVGFAEPEDVEAVLEGLAGRTEPLVRNVGRGPGQSHDRWVQLIGETADEPGDHQATSAEAAPPVEAHRGGSQPGSGGPDMAEASTSIAGESVVEPGADLAERVADLEARLARLEAALGVD